MSQEREYNFPVFGTQGGGLVREIETHQGFQYIFVEAPPTGMGLAVGDFKPEEWDIIPANEKARQAIREEQFGDDLFDRHLDMIIEAGEYP